MSAHERRGKSSLILTNDEYLYGDEQLLAITTTVITNTKHNLNLLTLRRHTGTRRARPEFYDPLSGEHLLRPGPTTEPLLCAAGSHAHAGRTSNQPDILKLNRERVHRLCYQDPGRRITRPLDSGTQR